jgi:branched-chain amino acid transport system permease protein
VSELQATAPAQPRVAVSRRASQAALLALLILLFLLPAAANGYILYAAAMMGINAIVAMGFNIVIGFLGQLAFATTAFFGIGAYTAGIVMTKLGLPYPVGVAAALLTGALAGLLAGLPALRLKGYELAIVTLAFNELMRWLYLHTEVLTNGATGLPLPPIEIFGWGVDTDADKYILVLVATICVLVLIRNLSRSSIGRAFVSVRENDLAAAALALAPARYKVLGFVLSGATIGLGGALFAAVIGRVSPESFSLAHLLLSFAMVMVGGSGTVAGPVLGAILLTAAPEFLRNIPGAEELIFSLLMIGVLVFMPAGLYGPLVWLFPGLRERHRGPLP